MAAKTLNKGSEALLKGFISASSDLRQPLRFAFHVTFAVQRSERNSELFVNGRDTSIFPEI